MRALGRLARSDESAVEIVEAKGLPPIIALLDCEDSGPIWGLPPPPPPRTPSFQNPSQHNTPPERCAVHVLFRVCETQDTMVLMSMEGGSSTHRRG